MAANCIATHAETLIDLSRTLLQIHLTLDILRVENKEDETCLSLLPSIEQRQGQGPLSSETNKNLNIKTTGTVAKIKHITVYSWEKIVMVRI